jgi:hypothetical protein
MNTYIEQLETAARAVTILSPFTFAWQGLPSPRLAPHVVHALSPTTARAYLLYNLQYRIYNDFYGQGPPPSTTPHPLFLERIQNANKTGTCWDPGWKPTSDDTSPLTVERGGLMLSVQEGEYRASPSDSALALRLGKDLPDISPGFYTALGNLALTAEDERDLVRLYWHVTPEGAVLLVEAATLSLNAAGLPFRLKVISNPSSFIRRDAAILYFRAVDYHTASPYLASIYTTVAPHLKEGVPALTEPLLPGLALAEDPGGQSFGLHRSMLIAEGLTKAYDNGEMSPAQKLSSIIDRFQQASISLETPYLNPGSKGHYPAPLVDRRTTAHRPPTTDEERPATDNRQRATDSYLRVAHDIGTQIVRDAIWHGSQCNWIGALPPGTTGIPNLASACRALGPDLYAGTAGVALFLAELYGATGDDDVRRAAIGALSQALSMGRRLPPGEQLALYTGALGIVLTALRASRLIHEERLHVEALNLLDSILADPASDAASPRHDYLSGHAGSILALLALQRYSRDDKPLELAARMGGDLLHAANKTRRGYSWPSSRNQKHHDLTGLSHGAAGIALALFELAGVTGDPRFFHAAQLAFAYERSWFDPTEANWPDFRFQPTRRDASSGQALSFRTFWCHGAPGIALSRLRAYSLAGDPIYHEEAATALETTHNAVVRTLSTTIHDFSLCHGLAGNCAVLLAAPSLMSNAAPYAGAVLRAASEGVSRFASNHQPWPCGVGGGHTPSLMLGTAGIGLFYLRLHNPQIPSPLLLPALA